MPALNELYVNSSWSSRAFDHVRVHEDWIILPTGSEHIDDVLDMTSTSSLRRQPSLVSDLEHSVRLTRSSY